MRGCAGLRARAAVQPGRELVLSCGPRLHRAVKGLEANFIETGASQTFELMFRFYGVAPVKNLGQGLASHQPRARLLAMAMTVPSISRYMKSSLILIGMVPHHPW
jgi:hypothetical protein